ncbi:L,D-transpeptidase family protein [Isoptericola sp. AK164]|uniref:L,D-transpeptidase family protein n=1 Tax=Isoptericola sp. AK164 TaxID=3024246 RepID=UPI0024187E40|nr:L,D-transpeptidase family protein [Isoptericola sp. AK164]
MTGPGRPPGRRAAAAAAVVALLLLGACGPATSEPTDTAASTTPTPPSPAADPSAAASVTPSAVPEPDPTVPDPTPSATASPEPEPSPSMTTQTSPASTADPSDGTAEPDAADDESDGTQDGASSDTQKPDEKKTEKKPEKNAPAPEPDYVEVGSRGAEVRELQERLVELGYFLPSVDGVFGPQTQQAVWALQKAAGLYRDAVVGPRTESALDDGVRPRTVSSSGKVVEIDLDRQLLLAVQDGRVVRAFNASSGNGETFEAKGRSYRATTPRGTFAVYMERDYLHESTLELGAMYRPKYFTGGIAVHGSPSIPPVPASHGCIRVSNAAMNWLWDSWGMPRGTTVVVH